MRRRRRALYARFCFAHLPARAAPARTSALCFMGFTPNPTPPLTLLEAVRLLRRDLHNNAAQACLALERWEEAAHCAGVRLRAGERAEVCVWLCVWRCACGMSL